MRARLVKNRTALANEIRGLLHEFGLIIPQGINKVISTLTEILDSGALSQLSYQTFSELKEEFIDNNKKITELEKRLKIIAGELDKYKQLTVIPGIGLITATALIAVIGNAKYFDALIVKVRQDKRIINKAVYVALGVDLTGRKDILGLCISENEGAKFWLNNFTEMKDRGLKDILIACSDNLTGMSEAISAVYPQTEHQLCIVHQIRNSLSYVSYKDRKELAADLKLVYSSITEDEALTALSDFDMKWGKQYPHIAKSWQNNWQNLIIFLQYSEVIRRIIYTTNAIEGLNSQLRKVTNNKRGFPNDDSVFKTLYLTIDYITRKWNMPIQNWGEAMAHFLIKFEGRI